MKQGIVGVGDRAGRRARGHVLAIIFALTWGCGTDGVITLIDSNTPVPPNISTPTPVPRPSSTPTEVIIPSPTATRNPADTDCCEGRVEPGCEVPACETCVCDLDAYCCGEAPDPEDPGVWDSTCAQAAADECFADCGCPQ